MICPKCEVEQPESTECRSCGLIFEKWFKQGLEAEEKNKEVASWHEEGITVFTQHYRIDGFVLVPGKGYRGRLSDYLNQKDFTFLPITRATILNHAGEIIIPSAKVIILNKNEIAMVLPSF